MQFLDCVIQSHIHSYSRCYLSSHIVPVMVDKSCRAEDIQATTSFTPESVKPLRAHVNFEKNYEILKHLGDGKFGKVYHVRDRDNGKEYAAKFVKLKRDSDRSDLEREVSILNHVGHPKIVEMHDAFVTNSNNVVLVMEIVRGGELFDRIADENYVVSEKNVAVIIRQLCEAINYLHQQHIIHLDIKPENIMLISQKCHEIKLIDFGLARYYDGNQDLKFMAGTPEFAAPEVIKYESLDYHTDMWSIGVITYILLSGYSPFLGDTLGETYCNVEKGEWSFTEEFDIISEEAKDFITKLLVYNKDLRMLPKECLSHPWLVMHLKAKDNYVKESAKRKLRDINKSTGDDGKKNSITAEIKNITAEAKKTNTTVSIKKEERLPIAKKAETFEISCECSFVKKSIKRGLIRRIKSESFSSVSASFRSHIREKVTTGPAIVRRKVSVANPKRVVKRSDDDVITVHELQPIRKASKALVEKKQKLKSIEQKSESITPLKVTTNKLLVKSSISKNVKDVPLLLTKQIKTSDRNVVTNEPNILLTKAKIVGAPRTPSETTSKESVEGKPFLLGRKYKELANKPVQTPFTPSEKKIKKPTCEPVINGIPERKNSNVKSSVEPFHLKKKNENEIKTKEKMNSQNNGSLRKNETVRKLNTSIPEMARTSSHKENGETMYSRIGQQNVKPFDKSKKPDRIDLVLADEKNEFSFDILKEKLIRRVSGASEDPDLKKESRLQAINIPNSYTVQDRLKKFENLRKFPF